jgi:flavin-dependent dehydrogenase
MPPRTCDVLVVGGGPAGSSCALALKSAGAHVVVMDRARFPRDKVCAGWITPAVLAALGLTPEEYRAAGLTLQELRGFRTACEAGPVVDTRFDEVVSYAVRRCEFDTFLLRRSGAHVLEGTALSTLRRDRGVWIANDAVAAPLVVGAGGHFCPVARRIRPAVVSGLVVAREIEIPLLPSEPCGVRPDTPELFFNRDLEGYGWCVRKDRFLNVGIGRRVTEKFNRHALGFVEMLAATRRVPERALRTAWRGHAYLLAGAVDRPPIADGLLLVGDAAGLAAWDSGEGIGPAVDSGLLAARVVASARGRYTETDLSPYVSLLPNTTAAAHLSRRLRALLPAGIGRLLLSSPSFTRRILTQWFVREQPQAAGWQLGAGSWQLETGRLD